MSFDQDFQSKRKYSRISIKKRQNLVTMVIQKQLTIACASRRLGLKASTARMILNKYIKTGTYPVKNFKKPIKQTSLKSTFIKEEDNDQSYRIQQNLENNKFSNQQFALRLLIYGLRFFLWSVHTKHYTMLQAYHTHDLKYIIIASNIQIKNNLLSMFKDNLWVTSNKYLLVHLFYHNQRIIQFNINFVQEINYLNEYIFMSLIMIVIIELLFHQFG